MTSSQLNRSSGSLLLMNLVDRRKSPPFSWFLKRFAVLLLLINICLLCSSCSLSLGYTSSTHPLKANTLKGSRLREKGRPLNLSCFITSLSSTKCSRLSLKRDSSDRELKFTENINTPIKSIKEIKGKKKSIKKKEMPSWLNDVRNIKSKPHIKRHKKEKYKTFDFDEDDAEERSSRGGAYESRRNRESNNAYLEVNSWETLINSGMQLPTVQDLKATATRPKSKNNKNVRNKRGGQSKARNLGKMDHAVEGIRRGKMLTFQAKEETGILEDSLFDMKDELKCFHFQKCSGCTFNSDLTSTPIMEEAKSFFRSLSPSIEDMKISLQTPYEWRTQAKLAVAPISKWGGVDIGLYQEGTHDVISIPQCRVHHPSINIAVDIISKACDQAKIRAYDEEKGEGHLRYIQLAVDRRSNKVQATFVWNKEDYKAATPEIQHFVKTLSNYDINGTYHPNKLESSKTIWHSIYANFKTQSTNSIFNRNPYKWHHYFGSKYVSEAVGPLNIVYYFVPQLFRQGNLDGFSNLVKVLREYVPEEARVCELYAGVGIIGLNLIDKIKSLKFSDINPFLGDSVDKTLKTLYERIEREEGPEKRKALEEKILFQVATAEEALIRGDCAEADVLIVDPPRKGLEQSIIDQLVNIPSQKHNPRTKDSSSDEDFEMYGNGRETGLLDENFELVDFDSMMTSPKNGKYRLKDRIKNQKSAQILPINPHAISPNLKRIIYVSCGFQALKRDATALMKGGGGSKWRVVHAEGFVLFPGSDHIETLCIFDRVTN